MIDLIRKRRTKKWPCKRRVKKRIRNIAEENKNLISVKMPLRILKVMLRRLKRAIRHLRILLVPIVKGKKIKMLKKLKISVNLVKSEQKINRYPAEMKQAEPVIEGTRSGNKTEITTNLAAIKNKVSTSQNTN